MRENNQRIKVYTLNEGDLLNRFQIDRRQIDDYQLLCLPENFLEATSKGQLYDAEDSDKLCESFRKAGLKSANSADLNLNPHNQYAIRKSFDILWLGVVLLVARETWDFAKLVLSDFVSDFIRDFLKKQEQQENPVTRSVSFPPEAKITLILRKDGEVAAFEYFNDATEMLPSLDKKVKKFFSKK